MTDTAVVTVATDRCRIQCCIGNLTGPKAKVRFPLRVRLLARLLPYPQASEQFVQLH
jgi:hypothetical protein